MTEDAEDWFRITELAKACELPERTLYAKVKSGELESREMDGLLHARRSQCLVLKERKELHKAELLPQKPTASPAPTRDERDPELILRKKLANQAHLERQQRAAEVERLNAEREAQEAREQEEERRYARLLRQKQLEAEVERQLWLLEQEKHDVATRRARERDAEIAAQAQREQERRRASEKRTWESIWLNRMSMWLTQTLGGQFVRDGLRVSRESLKEFEPGDPDTLVERALIADLRAAFSTEFNERESSERSRRRESFLRIEKARALTGLAPDEAIEVERHLAEAQRELPDDNYDRPFRDSIRAARGKVEARRRTERDARQERERAAHTERRRGEERRKRALEEQRLCEQRSREGASQNHRIESEWRAARSRLRSDVLRGLPFSATTEERQAAVSEVESRFEQLRGELDLNEALSETEGLILAHRDRVQSRLDEERRAQEKSRAVRSWLSRLPYGTPVDERDAVQAELAELFERTQGTARFQVEAEAVLIDYRK